MEGDAGEAFPGAEGAFEGGKQALKGGLVGVEGGGGAVDRAVAAQGVGLRLRVRGGDLQQQQDLVAVDVEQQQLARRARGRALVSWRQPFVRSILPCRQTFFAIRSPG